MATFIVLWTIKAILYLVRDGHLSWKEPSSSWEWRAYLASVVFFVGVFPIAWNWWETQRFYEWLYREYQSSEKIHEFNRSREAQMFTTYVENARRLWAAFLAILAATIVRN